MPILRPSTLLRTSRSASRKIHTVLRRRYATEPASSRPPSTPPNSNNKPPSRVGAYYKSFSYPLLKSFLGALFTYQLAYYLWLKLEVIEEKYDRQSEISGLQTELKEAVVEQRARAKDAVGKLEEKADDFKEGVKKKGWWGW